MLPLASFSELSTVAVIGVVAAGVLENTVVLFGWMTFPLVLGAAYIIVWLIAYLVYFFRFWPYR